MLTERLKAQLLDRDQTVAALQRSLAALSPDAPPTPAGETDDSLPLPSPPPPRHQQIAAVHDALRRIAEEAICDADDDFTDSRPPSRGTSRSPARSPTRGRHTSPSPSGPRVSSPLRSRSPALADATFATVQAALHKRHLQVN